MNCEQVRTAIDTDSPASSLSSHLRNCADCQQYKAETASLLNLLGAQAYVQAPMNFEARLQARLASEDVKLAALVGALPTVHAPANFEFQLQRRLAQVNAEKTVRTPLAWVEQFFGQSFSFGSFAQAGSALAAVALVVTFSVMQFSGNGTSAPGAGEMVATNLLSAPTQESAAPLPASVPSSAPVAQSNLVKAAGRITRHLTATTSKVSNLDIAKASLTEPRLVANAVNERVILNAQTRQEAKLATNGTALVAYGQQMTKFLAAPKAEPANIAF